MKTKKRPQAARQLEHRTIGDFVDYKSTVGDGDKFSVQGIVIVSAGSMRMEFENGDVIDGIVNIIKVTFCRGGMNYVVTCNGSMIHADGFAAEFAKLSDAAEFIGV